MVKMHPITLFLGLRRLQYHSIGFQLTALYGFLNLVVWLWNFQLATNNFNYDNKLREGGFCSVYWVSYGMLLKEKLQLLVVSSIESMPTSLMVDIDVEILTTFDPFAEAKDSDVPGAKEYVHIRIQQRNGKKSLTKINY